MSNIGTYTYSLTISLFPKRLFKKSTKYNRRKIRLSKKYKIALIKEAILNLSHDIK